MKNLNRNEEITVSVNGEYWLDYFDTGQAEGTPNSFKFVDQIGETVYNTTIGPRQMSLAGWVAGWDDEGVSLMKQRLNRLINPKHNFEVYANGKKIGGYSRTSIVYSPTYTQNNSRICKFLVTFYCPYPLFTDEYGHEVSVSYTQKLFHFPLIIPKGKGVMMGIRQPSLIAEVTNEGDLPIGYEIEFKALGQVVNPILTDIGTQQFIEIEKTMANGERIIINTKEGYRKVTGIIDGEEQNYFKYRSFDSSWLTLDCGINYLRYNAEAGVSALEVIIRFEPGYLEVDK